MKTQLVNQTMSVTVNPDLEKELPPLDAERLAHLTTMLKRDGINSPIQYWFNPDTQQNEIIDGHNRYRLAQELGLPFELNEVIFTDGSITAVRYWMHVNQSGRRGSSINGQRVTELREQLAKERGQPISRTQAVKEVAKDAKVSERSIWRNLSPTDRPKAPKSRLDKAKSVIGDMPKDEILALIDFLQSLLD